MPAEYQFTQAEQQLLDTSDDFSNIGAEDACKTGDACKIRAMLNPEGKEARVYCPGDGGDFVSPLLLAGATYVLLIDRKSQAEAVMSRLKEPPFSNLKIEGKLDEETENVLRANIEAMNKVILLLNKRKITYYADEREGVSTLQPVCTPKQWKKLNNKIAKDKFLNRMVVVLPSIYRTHFTFMFDGKPRTIVMYSGDVLHYFPREFSTKFDVIFFKRRTETSVFETLLNILHSKAAVLGTGNYYRHWEKFFKEKDTVGEGLNLYTVLRIKTKEVIE